MGQKQKTEKERKRERAKVGDNNGQATHGACKHAWHTQAAWANYLMDTSLPVLIGRRLPGALILTHTAFKAILRKI